MIVDGENGELVGGWWLQQARIHIIDWPPMTSASSAGGGGELTAEVERGDQIALCGAVYP